MVYQYLSQDNQVDQYNVLKVYIINLINLGKLVQVIVGSILDVAVDIRVGSSTFGKYHAEISKNENFISRRICSWICGNV